MGLLGGVGRTARSLFTVDDRFGERPMQRIGGALGAGSAFLDGDTGAFEDLEQRRRKLMEQKELQQLHAVIARAPRSPATPTVTGGPRRAGRDIAIKKDAPRLSDRPTGEHGAAHGARFSRGDGFSGSEWADFNRDQQSAANDMAERAKRLWAEADRLDQKGQDGGNRLREAAKHLQDGAANLRDTSAAAPKAHFLPDKEYFEARRLAGYTTKNPDSQAFTTQDGRSATFRRGDLNIFGERSPRAKWNIGHEALHTLGLIDERGPDGKHAYLDSKAFRRIRGTKKEIRNPDSLMSWVYPSFRSD